MKLLLAIIAVGAAVLGISWANIQALDRYGVESAARGGLGTLRIRIEETRKATGAPPARLDAVPVLWEATIFPAPHQPTSAVISSATGTARDGGSWAYDSRTGAVFIDCTHTDSKLSFWTSY